MNEVSAGSVENSDMAFKNASNYHEKYVKMQGWLHAFVNGWH